LDTAPYRELTSRLRRARSILIFTGAGISTASGLPDFRGPQGIWKHRQPIYFQDFLASEKARIEYWAYKLEGWDAYRNAQPNAVHRAIVELEREDKLRLLVTQNVDGLHRNAGTPPERLVELHGTNLEVECLSCRERSDPSPHFAYFKQTGKPPTCSCGGLLKPATISFGQNLRPQALNRASEAALEADLVVALGSTLSVYPAASIPLLAAEQGAPYVIVNRGETDHDGRCEVTLRMNDDVLSVFPSAVTEAL